MPITDAQLSELQQHVGRHAELLPWHRVATRDAIWHFAAAVGDDNPLWWDIEYASRAVPGSIVAPPSYFYTCDRGLALPGSTDVASIRDGLLPDVPSIWMRSRWEWFDWMREGERVSSHWELEGAVRRSDGESVRQTERFKHMSEAGIVLATETREVLRRTVGDRMTAPGEPEPAPTFAWEPETLYGSDTVRFSGIRVPGSVRVGDTLGRLTKGPLTLMNLVNWLMGWGSPMAFSNRLLWEYLREHRASAVPDRMLGIPEPREVHHLVGDAGRGAAFASGYDFGAQRIAWMIHLLTDWAGEAGFLRSLDVRLLAANPIGQVAVISGAVSACSELEDGELVEASVFADSVDGSRLASGVATIALRDWQ